MTKIPQPQNAAPCFTACHQQPMPVPLDHSTGETNCHNRNEYREISTRTS